MKLPNVRSPYTWLICAWLFLIAVCICNAADTNAPSVIQTPTGALPLPANLAWLLPVVLGMARYIQLEIPNLIKIFPYLKANGGVFGIVKSFFLGDQLPARQPLPEPPKAASPPSMQV